MPLLPAPSSLATGSHRTPPPKCQAWREAWVQRRGQGQTSHGTENVRRVGTDGSVKPPWAWGQAHKGRRQDPRCWEKVTVRSMSLQEGAQITTQHHGDGAPNACHAPWGCPVPVPMVKGSPGDRTLVWPPGSRTAVLPPS